MFEFDDFNHAFWFFVTCVWCLGWAAVEVWVVIAVVKCVGHV